MTRSCLDALGVCASSLCMVHCVVFPVLLAAFPVLRFSKVSSNAATSTTTTSQRIEAELHGTTPSASAIATKSPCCSTTIDYWIHVGMLATVAPMGLLAWSAGFLQHRRLVVPGLGLFGVSLLCAALLFGHNLLHGRGELILTVAGSICMVSAHLCNGRQRRCCRIHQHPEAR